MPESIRLCPAILLVCVLAAAVDAGAQTAATAPQETPRRPRIGLALGGGSARGLAHIGVLEWFEEHHIPIDFIGGTSMGGLVAGAYASGMTPAEIRELMHKTDWDVMFLADSPFRYKTFRRKQDRRAYPAQLEFGLKGGIRMPGGLNPGQQVALLLDRIAAPYPELVTFDELPTPFRCVATDLRKGEPVVLGKGSLALAMRATMAIPGVFTPVTQDNSLLVDGGVLNNIPADVVRAMGADIVIAVNVAADSEEEERIESLFALLGKTIDTMMSTGTRKALEAADVIIDPDLKGLGSTDWRRSDDLADRGHAATDAQSAALSPYALTPEAHAQFMAARQARRRLTTPTPTLLETPSIIGDLSPALRREIERQFTPELNQPLDPDRITERILEISGTDRFEYLTYRTVTRDNGTGLIVGARTKSYGPPFLALGLELSNIDSSSFSVNFGGRITTYDIIGGGSEGRLDLGIGTEQLVAGELYRPFGLSGFFVAPRAYYNRYGRNGYLDDQFVAEYKVKRTGVGFDFGYTTGRRFELRAGGDFASTKGRIRVGNPDLPEADGAERYARLQVVFDGQTSPIVPSRGLYVRAGLRHYFDTADITTTDFNGQPIPDNPDQLTQGEVSGSWFRRGRGDDRMFVGFGLGTSFGDDPFYNDYSLGGILRLGAFNNDQLRGPDYANFNVGYLYQAGRMPDVLGGNIYLGAWLESGAVWDDWDDRDWHNNATLGIIIESLLGPVFLGGSFDHNHGRFYVAVGPLFR